MIQIELPAPYVSLAILVDSISTAVVRADRTDTPSTDARARADVSLYWEATLRKLMASQAISGHDLGTLAEQPWHLLEIERDVFWIEDLNRCKELLVEGLAFRVIPQEDDSELVAFLAERTANGKSIDWQYWVGKMPELTTAQGCRLLAGLDPDLYADIRARPVPRNNVDDVCQKVVMLERLATAERKTSDSAAGWLAWAREHKFATHIGFSLAVVEFGKQPPEPAPYEEVVYTLASWPKLEAKTEWTGSRLAGADYFNLADAAELASRHAGCDVSVKDFLRAGGRGEISVHAICRRPVVMAPTRPTDSELNIQAGSFPTLPMSACKALALFGKAEWRHHEAWVHHDDFGGDLCSFIRWRLSDVEPSITTTVEDCLVTGWHLHALADAMKATAPAAVDGDAANSVRATASSHDDTHEETQAGSCEADVVDAGPTEAVPRQAAQENQILLLIQQMGHKPTALPANQGYKAGVKSEVKQRLKGHRLFVSAKVFDKAWERLSKDGRIGYRP